MVRGGSWRRQGYAIAAIIGCLAAPARAQDTGTVGGTVVDPQGAAIPGATITLTDEKTRTTRTQVTAVDGEFVFRSVIPGAYTVKVELAGFRSFEKRSNIVNASSDVNLGKIKLEIGSLTEVVTVEARARRSRPGAATHGPLTSTQIRRFRPGAT